ncbi:hypothetical protein I4U23_010867, partial [Adineta vaga]
MPFVYHLSTNNTISVKQLQHALDLTISKHLALHTAFIFDKDKNILMQRIIDITTDQKTLFTFIESTYETQQQLNNIIHEEKRNPQLFNLTQGLVFRCHLVYYKHISSDHLLHHKDIIIFNFHHEAFDFPSMHIFLHDLNQVYTTGELLSNNNNNDDEMNIRYLDYAAIERGMSMTGAEMFWLDTLHDCKLDQSLSLPYDRYRLANEHRTGRGTSISFDFGQDLSQYFLTYASTNNMSLEYLSLMTYFIFLFKLTNGEQDLCIGMNTDGRYRDEFRSLIGMFVNAIPLRCQFDPHSSFHQFTQQMRVLMTNSMKYSYFPLQRILAQHPHLSSPAFLDTSFQFITSMTNDDQDKVNLGDSELILAPYSIEISEDEVMSKFDFILTFHHTLDPNELSCTIDASLDLFHVETMNKISQQFHSLLYDLCASIIDSQSKKPLYELSLTLPTEQLLVQSMNNTQISFPSVKCIHHEFVSKAMIYSQKLAVELDEQSLTYCELLYYVQVLSLTLLNEYRVNVIGIMGILMAGGVYCPLSPRDPPHREVIIRGVGIFAGYLDRDDLTAQALIEIDGDINYRTGDMVKMDFNGNLNYQGRKDFQVKLHGQRIELGEIERCLLSITSISTCVVVKWGEDHLVAYVQSSVVSEKELHEYCQSHLPPHMIPSYFIILDKLPLNPNGKIDRKRLPSPDSLVLSSTKLNNTNDLVEPTNKIESIIHHIWCDLLKQKQISTNTNIFSIGGHSLIIMQLLHHYKVEFRLEINSIAITDLFQHPTIIDHAKLIHQILNTELSKDDHSWHSLNILTAKASFAQERIFLDENIRFSSSSSSSSSTDNNTNMYVIPLIYRLSSINDHHISISRLYHAYQCIIRKHQILRTALYLDQNGIIVQDCRDMNTLSNNSETFGFSIVNVSREDGDMNEIVKRILNKCDLFDLSKGHVINCHILRSHTHSSNEEDDMLNRDDLILFTVHHAFFDGASTSIFIRDLSLAYQDHSSLSLDDNSFQYVDYSVHEHVMDMSLSREFWYSQLQGCDLQHSLSLPYDRSRSSIHHRSGLGATTQIILNDVTCTSFLNYASSHHLTFFQLGLSIFYVFLFKLSHNQTDLCVGSINANRYRSELYNMIGMFVATLPYRIQLNGDWSFDEVVHSVREMCLSILKHSHYPLQHILNDFHANQSNLNFLEIMFDFITLSESESSLSMNDTKLEQGSLEQSDEMAQFDFMLTFVYDPTLQNNRLSLYFICSHDLFDDGTVTDIGERFSYCIEQLFVSNGIVDEVNMCGTAVSKLDLILAKEAKEIDDVIFDRQSNITSEAPASYAQARIWLDEQLRFDPQNPQVAIYNMPFVYHLSTNNTISVKQLQHALDLTISKHLALHTAFIFDKDKNILMQRIIDITTDQKTLFTFIESTYETQQQLNNIIHEEKRNPQLFNLTQGLVFRCHLVYYKHISSDHLLHHKDIIIFNFHHEAFDFPSMHIFLHDLNQVYTTGELLSNNNNNDDEMNIRYLDYAAIERGMSMTGAEMFWLDTLHDCKLDQSLSLPYDRYRLANEHRTGRGTSISFDFGQDLSQYFLTYASTNNMSLEYLSLMTYFIFLFKLTNGEQDLCIGMNTDGRYRDELRSLIGMFVNAIPLRCQFDPHSSFHQFTQQMRVLMTNSMKYSYFPLQRILAQHPHLSSPAFLDTSFQFITSMTNDDQDKVNLGDSELILAPYSIEISEDEVMSKFDFILTFHHTLDPNELSCTIDASLDLFHVETMNKISQQFHSLLYDLCASIIDSQSKKPLYELSLTLPTEQLLVRSMNNTQISFPSVKCIHHEFVSKAMIYSQKLAVELDEQSLTYCELLYYVQVLSLTLLNEYRVNVGDIICQCVERSISMVIGIMAIEMVGGVYCPLSPRDPSYRLHTLVEQTQSHLVIAHWLTKTMIHNETIVVNVDLILTNNDNQNNIGCDQLSNIVVTPKNIAYIIFTSGSTGVPKA